MPERYGLPNFMEFNDSNKALLIEYLRKGYESDTGGMLTPEECVQFFCQDLQTFANETCDNILSNTPDTNRFNLASILSRYNLLNDILKNDQTKFSWRFRSPVKPLSKQQHISSMCSNMSTTALVIESKINQQQSLDQQSMRAYGNYCPDIKLRAAANLTLAPVKQRALRSPPDGGSKRRFHF